MPRTAFICAMPMELEPLVAKLDLQASQVGDVALHTGTLGDHDVVAIVTGMGTDLATAGTERLLGAVDVDRVVVVGITGALESDTPIGTIIRPEVVVDGASGTEHRPTLVDGAVARGRMWTTNTLTTDPAQLADLRSQGVVSLDMETAAIAAVCEPRGIPWGVVRVISDRANDGTVTEEIFHLSNQDGTPNEAAITQYLEQHPEKLPALVQMAKDSELATNTAAEEAIRVCSR